MDSGASPGRKKPVSGPAPVNGITPTATPRTPKAARRDPASGTSAASRDDGCLAAVNVRNSFIRRQDRRLR